MEIKKINPYSFMGVYVNKVGMTNLQKRRADVLADVIPYIADIPEGFDLLISKVRGKSNRISVRFLEDGNYIRSSKTTKPLEVSSPFEKMDIPVTRNAFVNRVKTAMDKLASLKTYCNVLETGKPEVDVVKIVEAEKNYMTESYGLYENITSRAHFGLPIKLKK